MKIIRKSEAVHRSKPDKTRVDYYLRKEYEVIFSEYDPGITSQWHRHDKISETIFIIKGEITAQWKEGDKVIEEIVQAGDFIEVGSNMHTLKNHTDKIVTTLTIKQVLSDKDNRGLFKQDKITDKA